MRRRRHAAPVLVLVAATALVGAVLLARSGTAVPATWARPVGAGQLQPVVLTTAPRGGADLDGPDDLVLRRDGTASISLGQSVDDLRLRGWPTAGLSGSGCEEVVRPGAGTVRLGGWVRDGRVVAVRLDAPATPGLLLPTAVRTGWPVEAVLAGSDGLLRESTTTGPGGERVVVLTGRLPLGAWPPQDATPPPGPPRGPGRAVVAPDPAPPAVDLVLTDAGSGRVVGAEVRVPAARACTGGAARP